MPLPRPPLRRRFPIASLLLPAPSGVRAPPVPWSAQVWRRRNGCSARQARPSGSPRPAPPTAPPRLSLPARPGAGSTGAPGISLLTHTPRIPHPSPRGEGWVPEPRTALRVADWPPGYASAGGKRGWCSEREGKSSQLPAGSESTQRTADGLNLYELVKCSGAGFPFVFICSFVSLLTCLPSLPHLGPWFSPQAVPRGNGKAVNHHGAYFTFKNDPRKSPGFKIHLSLRKTEIIIIKK